MSCLISFMVHGIIYGVYSIHPPWCLIPPVLLKNRHSNSNFPSNKSLPRSFFDRLKECHQRGRKAAAKKFRKSITVYFRIIILLFTLLRTRTSGIKGVAAAGAEEANFIFADLTRLLYSYLDTCSFHRADYGTKSSSKVWKDRQNVLH